MGSQFREVKVLALIPPTVHPDSQQWTDTRRKE